MLGREVVEGEKLFPVFLQAVHGLGVFGAVGRDEKIESGDGAYTLTSNPYRAATSGEASAEESMGWTLGYVTKTGLTSTLKSYSGSTPPGPWGSNSELTGTVTTIRDANRTLVTDQAGKQGISEINALGHLTKVWEVTAQDSETESVSFPGTSIAYGYRTSYSYDPLNNLTTVNQGVQTRTFTYSPLSRLLTASNPESGTISYGYDPNGNLTTKTDARTVTTTYAYDALNRVTSRSYDDQVTPPVTYTYDDIQNVQFSKGRLTKVANSISTTEYTEFDQLGRIKRSKQTTGGTAYPEMTYKYNRAGALTEEKYPSGRVVKNSFDSVGRLSLVQASKNSSSGLWTYANSFTYNPAGAVTSLQLGNGTWEKAVFNSRLQPTQIGLGSTPGATNLLKLDYTYNTVTSGQPNPDNNGNVLTQKITVPTVGTSQGFTADQIYGYDQLNRIDGVNEYIDQSSTAAWAQDFSYDRYGNRNFNESNTSTLTKNCGTSPNFVMCAPDRERENPEIEKNTNRIKGLQPDGDQNEDYDFDAAGNMILDPDGRQFFYDGENKQIKVEDISTNVIGEYSFDGDGKRVKKHVPSTGEVTIFIYSAGGKLVAEYSTIVASQSTAQVSYLTNDHLGSPRITTDKIGKVYSRRDFMPFGEELTGAITGERIPGAGYGSDSVRQKFTGYERELETDSDFAQARYYRSVFGRFTGPDDFSNDTRPDDAQSWNLYSYVRNNPLRFVDPTGEKAWVAVTYDEKTKTYRFQVFASFGVYVAAGKVSSKEVEKQISRLEKQIEKGFKAKFLSKNSEFKFEVSATVVKVEKYSSESAAEEAAKRGEVDNIVGLIDGSSFQYKHPDYRGWRRAQGTSYRVHGENFDRMLVATDAVANVYAHEFGHLLGGSQQSEDFGLLNHAFTGADGPSELSPADYNEIFTQFRRKNDSSKAYYRGRREWWGEARANAAKWAKQLYRQ